MRRLFALHQLHRASRRSGVQRGQAMVIGAIAVVFLFGIAAVAIEGGLLEADRRFDQSLSDGAALAGAHKLPSSATNAAKAAVDYVIAGLNEGKTPATCDASGLYAAGGTLPAACDPSPTHSISFQTPYPSASNTDQIMVKLTHVVALNLAAVVGASNATTSSRSVAKSYTGGTPFGYAVYAAGDLSANGNTNTTVEGNVFVGGCIYYTNSDNLIVGPKGTQIGTVEVYDKNNVGVQDWTHARGTGCTANVTANQTSSQWGAGGHTSGTDTTCGFTDAPTNFGASCATAGEPPVKFVPVPGFSITDTTYLGSSCNSNGAVRQDFLTQGISGTVATEGCYSACDLTNSSVSIPSGTTFLPGTYAFFGNGTTGCDVIFQGTASNLTTGGDNTSGVTFILYNGTSICASACGKAQGNGTLTFNAPVTGSNSGFLIYSCNSVPCGSGSGQFWVKGPNWTTNFTGLIYNPGGDCNVISNSGEQIVGQLICNNVSLQGGSISLGTGVTYGGSSLPTPQFLASLIE